MLNRILTPHLILRIFLSSADINTTPHSDSYEINWFPRFGLYLANRFGLFLYLIYFGLESPRAISWRAKRHCWAISSLEAIWWISEGNTYRSHGISSADIYATAWASFQSQKYLPITCIFPLVWLLYMGGFLLATGIWEIGLHRPDCPLNIIICIGTKIFDVFVLGFILADQGITFDVDFKILPTSLDDATDWISGLVGSGFRTQLGRNPTGSQSLKPFA